MGNFLTWSNVGTGNFGNFRSKVKVPKSVPGSKRNCFFCNGVGSIIFCLANSTFLNDLNDNRCLTIFSNIKKIRNLNTERWCKKDIENASESEVCPSAVTPNLLIQVAVVICGFLDCNAFTRSYECTIFSLRVYLNVKVLK